MGVCGPISTTYFFPLIAAGHLGLTIGWIIPSIFVLCVALSLAELTSAMPAQMIVTGIAVSSDGRVTLGPAPSFGIILALLFSHAIVCPSNSRTLAGLSLFTGGINVAATIAIAIALIVIPGSGRTSASDAFGLLTNNSGWDSNDAAAHISEETSSAARAAPLAILSGLIGAEVLGFLFLVGASFASIDIPHLVGTTLGMPMGQVYLDTFGKKGMLAVWSLCIVLLWFSGISQGVDASRVTFALARDNALPGSKLWKQVHPLTKTPVYAVWLVIFLSAIIAVLVWSDTALSSLAG
ncbi:hypothetical protein D9756_000043 [Leucocoprinus leucothites]|uniref:Uncharacterized protein n=1 Tax=Leucocoprinus leucothites TaxID=201217 RepID=A0A8H5GEZ4_9AGAR|nr:hypothetical protein D9756_000043 [Leucoagaricus leucothites]